MMSAKIYYVLFVCLLLAPALACGGGGGEEPLPIAEVEEPAAEEPAAEEPAAEEPAAEEPAVEEPAVEEPAVEEPAVEELAAEEPENEEEPGTEEAGDTFSTDSAPVIYTADGNPCIRSLYTIQLIPLSGEGLMPLDIDPGDAGDARDAVLAKLPHPALSFAAFAAPDGERIVTHADSSDIGNGDIQIWDMATGEEIKRLQHDEGYYSPAVSRQAPLLAAMAGAGEVWLWNLVDIREGSGVMAVNTGQRGNLTLSPDGRFFAVSTVETMEDDSTISSSWGVARLFDALTGEEVQRFEGELTEETVTTEDGSFERAAMMNGHGAPIRWLGFSPNGQALLTLSWIDRTMRLWDISSGEQLRCFEIGGYGDTYSASFSADGREIATASDENIMIWDTATSEVDRRIDFLDILDIETASAAFSADGSALITTSWDERAAYVLDSETGELMLLLRHPGFVAGVDASPDGRYFVTRMHDRDDASSAGAWIWDADHPALTRAAITQSLVAEGLERGKQGDLDGMLAAFEEAQDVSPGDDALLRPAIWNRVCRYGSLGGGAEAVLEACDTAVQLVEEEAVGFWAAMTVAAYRDNRGLARALTGDFVGAIEDFQYFVDNAWISSSTSDLRRSWINALQNGRNPFDEATLEALRNE